MDDCYLTIKTPSEKEIKIKGSRFIGRTFESATLENALEILKQVRKQEYSATHNCYAYIIGEKTDEVVFKYSDDGEPSGTAGRPIYDVVCGSNLTNILVVVTRYFGGTKLGTGGLVRAYGDCARMVLEKSGTRENFLATLYNVEIEFPLYDRMLKLINKIGARQVSSDFSEVVNLKLEIRLSLAERLVSEIVELSGGKAKIEETPDDKN